MAENTFKEAVHQTGEKKREPGKVNGIFRTLLDGSFLTFDKSPGLLPLLLFLSSIAILLIANNFYAERKVREIENLRSEVTELRTIYISNKAELMYLSNQSEIAKRLDDKGFVESTVPPRILREQQERRSFLLRIFRTKQ